MALAYCEVPIGGGTTIVDVEDHESAIQSKWYALKSRKTTYATRHIWRDGKRTTEGMHRMILSAESGTLVDHANHDGLDNRRSNLRFATRSQNKINSSGIYRNKRSCEYIGVTPMQGKWQAHVGHAGKRVYVGLFGTSEKAARARDRRALELHGEFATLNFDNTKGSDSK